MTSPFSKLVQTLERSGYFQNYLTFGDGNLRPWDWERTARLLQGKPKLLWETFLCGKPADRAQLEKILPKGMTGILIENGICAVQDDKITFGSNALLSCYGN